MRFKGRIYIMTLILSGFVILFSGCEKKWGDYYEVPDHAEIKLWDAIQDSANYSEFVHYLKETGLDSILKMQESFTLFIPTNDAFVDFNLEGGLLDWVIGYHIAKTVFIPSNIKGKRKLETYIEKFALLTDNENGIFLDGSPISKNSPLFKDGVFYELENIAYPRPNLYEYMDLANPVLTRYIDSQDSVSLDYNESKPIGFDEDGNTVYDSVFIVTNLFEVNYFPVTRESRENEATFLVVSEEEYRESLNLMAENLKGSFVDYTDIPLDWQTEFLIPYIFKNGTFEGALTFDKFITDSLENIQGDMVPVDYGMIDPESATSCSNGIAFQYINYIIPEELYLEEIKYEGEDFVRNVGGGFFAWDEDRVKSSDMTKTPKISDNVSASEGKFLSVDLPRGSTAVYSIEIALPKIFPRKYKLAWRGNYRPSGLITFYVNGEYIGEFDNYNFRYPVNGNNPVDGFNMIEFNVENLTTYSDIILKMEYVDPGFGSLNGINIDYISLSPAE